ncbi:MAG: hypothetical protein AAGG75_03120 [Bacteroidota bacterium]
MRIAIIILVATLFGYSSQTPSGKYIAVKLVSTHQLSNDSVGHEWENFLSINRRIIKKGEKAQFKLVKRAPLIIEAHAIEKDPSYDDHGKSEITFTYSDLIAIERNRFEVRISVTENGGQNAGNLAEWMYIFELEKI